MSDMGQKPTATMGMETAAHDIRHSGRGPESGKVRPAASARLKTIHDLIRAGDYNIPATAIADCILENLMFHKLRRRY